MCMLCVMPPGVIPNRSKLENSALNNPHGFGFAIAVPSESRIICERTMDPDESINRFLELRTLYPEGYAMWHARFATHGSETVENCHPFIVGGDVRTYLAHNGILGVTPNKGDDRSDTRLFAEEVLPGMGGVTALDNDYVWEMLEDFAYGSKVCILTVDPAAKAQCYLLNEKDGAFDEHKVWWSNKSCEINYYVTSVSTKGSSGTFKPSIVTNYLSDDSYEMLANAYDPITGMYKCTNCDEHMTWEDLSEADNTCIACGFCLDCSSVYQDCLCRYSSDQKYDKRTGATIGRAVAKPYELSGWSNEDFLY